MPLQHGKIEAVATKIIAVVQTIREDQCSDDVIAALVQLRLSLIGLRNEMDRRAHDVTAEDFRHEAMNNHPDGWHQENNEAWNNYEEEQADECYPDQEYVNAFDEEEDQEEDDQGEAEEEDGCEEGHQEEHGWHQHPEAGYLEEGIENEDWYPEENAIYEVAEEGQYPEEVCPEESEYYNAEEGFPEEEEEDEEWYEEEEDYDEDEKEDDDFGQERPIISIIHEPSSKKGNLATAQAAKKNWSIFPLIMVAIGILLPLGEATNTRSIAETESPVIVIAAGYLSAPITIIFAAGVLIAVIMEIRKKKEARLEKIEEATIYSSSLEAKSRVQGEKPIVKKRATGDQKLTKEPNTEPDATETGQTPKEETKADSENTERQENPQDKKEQKQEEEATNKDGSIEQRGNGNNRGRCGQKELPTGMERGLFQRKAGDPIFHPSSRSCSYRRAQTKSM